MNTQSREDVVAAVVINEWGEAAAQSLAGDLPGLQVYRNKRPGELTQLTAELFKRVSGIVFFAAVGIVVRMIAPHVESKYSDPAVVAVDAGCRYAVSLLSGHEGGANELCRRVSLALGAEAVITTATEARRNYVIGVGARAAVSKEQVLGAVQTAMQRCELSAASIRCAATIGKKCAEPGLVDALAQLEIPLFRVSLHQLRVFGTAFATTAAQRHLDVPAVAEPCAMLAARDGELVMPLLKQDGVTVAVARERVQPLQQRSEDSCE